MFYGLPDSDPGLGATPPQGLPAGYTPSGGGGGYHTAGGAGGGIPAGATPSGASFGPRGYRTIGLNVIQFGLRGAVSKFTPGTVQSRITAKQSPLSSEGSEPGSSSSAFPAGGLMGLAGLDAAPARPHSQNAFSDRGDLPRLEDPVMRPNIAPLEPAPIARVRAPSIDASRVVTPTASYRGGLRVAQRIEDEGVSGLDGFWKDFSKFGKKAIRYTGAATVGVVLPAGTRAKSFGLSTKESKQFETSAKVVRGVAAAAAAAVTGYYVVGAMSAPAAGAGAAAAGATPISAGSASLNLLAAGPAATGGIYPLASSGAVFSAPVTAGSGFLGSSMAFGAKAASGLLAGAANVLQTAGTMALLQRLSPAGQASPGGDVVLASGAPASAPASTPIILGTDQGGIPTGGYAEPSYVEQAEAVATSPAGLVALAVGGFILYRVVTS